MLPIRVFCFLLERQLFNPDQHTTALNARRSCPARNGCLLMLCSYLEGSCLTCHASGLISVPLSYDLYLPCIFLYCFSSAVFS